MLNTLKSDGTGAQEVKRTPENHYLKKIPINHYLTEVPLLLLLLLLLIFLTLGQGHKKPQAKDT